MRRSAMEPALAQPEDEADLNNNRNNNNNNRRRGRGNNRPQGRGEQLNRIDSRARGNAPQLLEKYRKLAQDAHLNGDRVTAEYYLQFADHYFRVIADARQRQEEQRQRRDDRLPEDDNDDYDFSNDSDFPSFDQPVQARREERRPPREAGAFREPREEATETSSGENEPAFEQAAPNPFTRENRPVRARQPRVEREERRREPAPAPEQQPELGFDPSILPPSIEGSRGVEGEEIAPAPAPAPRRRGRPRKTPVVDSGSGEASGGPLEAVNG